MATEHVRLSVAEADASGAGTTSARSMWKTTAGAKEVGYGPSNGSCKGAVDQYPNKETAAGMAGVGSLEQRVLTARRVRCRFPNAGARARQARLDASPASPPHSHAHLMHL